MCGFAGLLANNSKIADLEQIAKQMAAAIAHRGPDDSGVWSHEELGFAVAHQRLAILDLSPAGHQPMVSSSGRYVIAFNGEIYNHLDLRTQLNHSDKPHIWKGNSDTETLLYAIETWGLQSALEKSVGMFALAVLVR